MHLQCITMRALQSDFLHDPERFPKRMYPADSIRPSRYTKAGSGISLRRGMKRATPVRMQ